MTCDQQSEISANIILGLRVEELYGTFIYYWRLKGSVVLLNKKIFGLIKGVKVLKRALFC